MFKVVVLLECVGVLIAHSDEEYGRDMLSVSRIKLILSLLLARATGICDYQRLYETPLDCPL